MKRELLSFAKNWNIPTIFVSTNTQEKAGDAFVKESQRIIDEEWGFGGFVKAYARVNSVAYSFRGMEVPVEGLEELVDETKKCLIDARKNKQNHFLRVQKVKIQERKQAMIAKSKKLFMLHQALQERLRLVPYPLAMCSLSRPFKQE
ncbi:hypothetical protein ACLGDS_03725 [Helicobacter pylori]